jgi:hypothetical protein
MLPLKSFAKTKRFIRAKIKLKTINNVLFRKAMATMQRAGNESLKQRALEVRASITKEMDQRNSD